MILFEWTVSETVNTLYIKSKVLVKDGFKIHIFLAGSERETPASMQSCKD